MINPAALEQLLVPAIEATAPAAAEQGLTDQQHADLATAVMLRALGDVDADDLELAGRLHAALTG